MPKNYIADSSALVALLNPADQHLAWIVSQAQTLPHPWLTCEAALSEAFFLLESVHARDLSTFLHRGALRVSFDLADQIEPVLALMEKYADVPMSLADACLVRMSEILINPQIVTTDSDFKIYRRHGRLVVPHLMP